MKAHLIISGTIQGVGYRFHVKRCAHQHHIRGFVRNLPDGRVDVFAVYDDPIAFEAFLKELDRKSQNFIGMHVEKIEVQPEGKPGFLDQGDFGPAEDFQIRF
ncbi:acylphosphatase [Candidatus Micrarchaeota archaeon]|nr:acylphosphatase [Candidatus Micrarchaeota archaeon]